MHEKLNILLVDDQPAKLLSYEMVLCELGENLIKANSAREAFGHLLRSDIAIVLADVCMPDLDGFELARMIREHPRFQDTAIIFVSGIATADVDRIRGYESGGTDYVQVPVVPEVLRAKVRVFAELHRQRRQLARLNVELERRVAERTKALERANAELEHHVEERTREREAALAGLHEAKRMESLGQLTGGAAHDFNNVLAAVRLRSAPAACSSTRVAQPAARSSSSCGSVDAEERIHAQAQWHRTGDPHLNRSITLNSRRKVEG